MFEFKTAMHAIPANQLYLYYFLLFALYLFFLRGIKPTYLTATIMLLFNQGFLASLLGGIGLQITKAIFVFLISVLLMKARITGLTRKERSTFGLFVLFTVLFFLNYIVNQIGLVWAFFQYFKYLFPVALYYVIKGLNLSDNDNQYYSNLIIKLLWFQIAFSVLKLLIIGLRENVIGSISNTGGGIGIGYAIMGTIMYWTMRGENLKGKDWWFVLLLLIIPAASNKRAIWLLYPIIIALLMFNRIRKQTLRKIATVIILIPITIYVGFRLNPTFNPERKLWGSFDAGYAFDYVLSYTGTSTEKLSGQYAQGRWGATSAILANTIRDPLSRESLFGFGKARERSIESIDWWDDYGLMEGTMISSIGAMVAVRGWLVTLLTIAVFLRLIYTIPDRKIARIVALYVLWDVMFYSGSMINAPTQSVLLILSIYVIKYHTQKNAERSNSVAKQESSEFNSGVTLAKASVRVR